MMNLQVAPDGIRLTERLIQTAARRERTMTRSPAESAMETGAGRPDRGDRAAILNFFPVC